MKDQEKIFICTSLLWDSLGNLNKATIPGYDEHQEPSFYREVPHGWQDLEVCLLKWFPEDQNNIQKNIAQDKHSIQKILFFFP